MTTEELKKLSVLAKIEINDGELENYAQSLNEMGEVLNAISNVNTESVPPTTHVTNLRNVWREDIVKPLPPEDFKQMMAQAPEAEGTFYKVEKILEA